MVTTSVPDIRGVNSAPRRTDNPIPRLSALPWIGAPRAVLSHPGQYLLNGWLRLGPVFGFRLFGMNLVAMIGPDANRLILISEREKFSHAIGYRTVTPLLGDGLLFQDGELHRRNRTLMMPAFHHGAVRGFFEVMSECAHRHATQWARAGRACMYDRFRRLTFEIMARLVLGVRGDLEIEHLSRLNDRLARGTTSFPRVHWRWTTYGKGVRARDELRAYLRGVIRERRDQPGTDALGLLMAAQTEDGEQLNEDELLEQAVILMFAGHETTTSMLTSFLLALERYSPVRSALRDEQRRVVGSGDLTADHLKDLDLLDRVLKEVERLWPPISLCQRGVVHDVEFAGYTIPAGASVVYSPWATHRLPEIFEQPDRFDPERFAPPRSEHRRTPCGLIGFGGGPRLCIGQAFALMEVKIVASLLLRGYTWDIESPDPPLRWVPTLHPRNGLPGGIVPIE